jgi:hypothetical protein
MGATDFSETLSNIYQTTRPNIPEDSNPYSEHCENSKSQINFGIREQRDQENNMNLVRSLIK